MKVMLTPQQHYAVKKHLTEVKKAAKKREQVVEIERLDTATGVGEDR